MEKFKGKAIYHPSGRAGEYSYWACNFYLGCSCGCHYCYNKKGRFKTVLGGDTPTLKKCFRGEKHALEVFEKELKQNLPELQKHGLFFSFTTDPLIYETYRLTLDAIELCVDNRVPVKLLTKSTENTNVFTDCYSWGLIDATKYIAIGFTLTGHDELEPNVSPNAERIEAMKRLRDSGFKTFASIEPIITLDDSLSMIQQTAGYCDLYKVGLLSGQEYNWLELRGFMLYCASIESKFYFKDSFLKQAKLTRDELPSNCVDRNYNIFKKNT